MYPVVELFPGLANMIGPPGLIGSPIIGSVTVLFGEINSPVVGSIKLPVVGSIKSPVVGSIKSPVVGSIWYAL